MRRECPVCSEPTISVSEILLSHSQCASCRSVVGVHWLASAIFSIVVTIVTLVTTLMVFLQMDLYAAILWFPFPIGSLSYVKARLCPLEEKQARSEQRGGTAT